MKRITALEKSRILEMYRTIPMKPWLFEQAATKEPVPSYTWDDPYSYESLISQGYTPEELKANNINPPIQPGPPTPMLPGDYIGSSRDKGMTDEDFNEMIEGWRDWFRTNPIGIGIEFGVSFHPLGRIAVSVLWGLFLAHDVHEAKKGNVNVYNIFADIIGIVAPHLLFNLDKLSNLKSVKNISEFAKKLGDTEILPNLVNLMRGTSNLFKSVLGSILSQVEKWLKYLTFGWAVKLTKWLGGGYMKIINYVDDFIEGLLNKAGIVNPVVSKGVTGGASAYVTGKAIEKIVDGVTYVWDETSKVWMAAVDVLSPIKKDIPKILKNLDPSFKWVFDDKGNREFYQPESMEWRVFFHGSNFQANYNGGRNYISGKGGWDNDFGAYFHKNSPFKPENYKTKK